MKSAVVPITRSQETTKSSPNEIDDAVTEGSEEAEQVAEIRKFEKQNDIMKQNFINDLRVGTGTTFFYR